MLARTGGPVGFFIWTLEAFPRWNSHCIHIRQNAPRNHLHAPFWNVYRRCVFHIGTAARPETILLVQEREARERGMQLCQW